MRKQVAVVWWEGGLPTISSGRVALWSALMVMALTPRATTARESPAQWLNGVRK